MSTPLHAEDGWLFGRTASQDGWRWVVSRGCKVAVLHGADSYAKMEQEFMSRLYPRRSTFYRLGADWRRVERYAAHREFPLSANDYLRHKAEAVLCFFHPTASDTVSWPTTSGDASAAASTTLVCTL
mgnify:CR=1 FL=1